MNKNIIFRVNDETMKEVDHKTRKNPEIYNNVSHFIRIAIMRELKRKV